MTEIPLKCYALAYSMNVNYGSFKCTHYVRWCRFIAL